MPDGDIVVVGYFTLADLVARYRIARLNSDGTLDTSLNLSPNSTIADIAVLSDGSSLLIGPFTWMKVNWSSYPTHLSGLVRLTATNTLDLTWGAKLPPGISSSVSQVVIESDRSVVVGGSFSNLGVRKANNLVRFSSNGVPDSSFSPNPDGAVRSILSIPLRTKIPVYSNRLSWINADGSAKSGASYAALGKINGTINSSLVLSDGRSLLGGDFTVPGYGDLQNLILLNADGSIDTTFRPQPNSTVYAIMLDSQNRLLIGGAFTTIGNISIKYLARVSLTGNVDTTFTTLAFSADIRSLVLEKVDSEYKVLVGGSFTSITSGSTSTTREYLARISLDGALDTSFSPTPDGMIYTMGLQSDGKILIGGAFTSLTPNGSLSSTTRRYFARLNSDGTLDANYNPSFNGGIYSHILLSDGKVIVGGAFTALQPNDATESTSRLHLAKLNTDGTLDTTYVPEVDAMISVTALCPDASSILIGGYFENVGGIEQRYLARIKSDGTLDKTYTPIIDIAPNILPMYPDGSTIPANTHKFTECDRAFLVGGDFAKVSTASHPYLALINTRGQAFAAFGAIPDGAVNAAIRQVDGKVIIGGAFSHVSGKARKSVARMDEAGTLDDLSVDMDGTVNAMAVQSDGRFIIAGTFTKVASVARAGIARLNSNGTLDTSFNPGVNGTVNAIKVELDGRIYVGGAFTTIAGSSQQYLARLSATGNLDSSFSATPDGEVKTLNTMTDGRVVIGGAFTKIGSVSRTGFAILGNTGALADSEDLAANGTINSLGITSDGRCFVGGSFTKFNGRNDFLIARLSTTTTAKQSLVVNSSGSSIRWIRSGTSATLSNVVFEYSGDGVTFSYLGAGSTTDQGATWTISGLTLPSWTYFYLRARGIASGNQGGASSLIEKSGAYYIGSTPSYTEASVVNGQVSVPLVIGSNESFNGTYFTATGLPEGMNIDPTTGRISGTPVTSGTYLVSITYSNGSIQDTWEATLVITDTNTSGSAGQCAAFAGRGVASSDRPLIIGFIVSGKSPMKVVLRGVGPSLTGLDDATPLSDVRMELYSSDGTKVLSQSGWSHSADFDATMARLGFEPFAEGSKDAAVVVTLVPGAYTFHLKGQNGASGVTVGQVYDANESTTIEPSHLSGCAVRCYVDGSTGGNVIGGIILKSSAPVKTLVSAVGLNTNGTLISGFMPDPKLSLHDTSHMIASNDDWGTQVPLPDSTLTLAPSSTVLATLPTPNLMTKDAALLTWLPGGIYTLLGSSADGQSGEIILQFILQ
jgi:uncharacterized delta-60 repeat protein